MRSSFVVLLQLALMIHRAELTIRLENDEKEPGPGLASLVELNRLARNSSILDSFQLDRPAQKQHHFYSIGSVRFKFNNDLLDLLERLNSSLVELKLVNFTSDNANMMPLFRTNLPLFRSSNLSRYF